jgi:hypothetical protein
VLWRFCLEAFCVNRRVVIVLEPLWLEWCGPTGCNNNTILLVAALSKGSSNAAALTRRVAELLVCIPLPSLQCHAFILGTTLQHITYRLVTE